jgi:hypothetical protein
LIFPAEKNFRTFGHNYLKQRPFELFWSQGDFYSLRSDPDPHPDPAPVIFRGQIRIQSKWTGSANSFSAQWILCSYIEFKQGLKRKFSFSYGGNITNINFRENTKITKTYVKIFANIILIGNLIYTKFLRKQQIFADRNFMKFSKNRHIFAWFLHFRENGKMNFLLNPSSNIAMSDSGLSDIGINFFSVGLIRYQTRGLQSDKFLSNIGLGCIDVGYRISATKIFDVAPTYGNTFYKDFGHFSLHTTA